MAIDAVDQLSRVRAALDALAAVDLDGCDRRAELEVVMERWRTVRSYTDAVEVRIARRSKALAAEGRSECAEGVLTDHGRRSIREARAAAARERAGDEMPCFEAALSVGEVSAGHVDAVAAATHGLDEGARAEFVGLAETLLRQAGALSVDVFAKECQELARVVAHDEGECRLERQRKQCQLRQWVDRVTGMYHIHAEFDPESGAKAWAAINAVTSTLRHAAHHRAPPAEPEVVPWDRVAAQALVELLTGARSVDQAGA